MQCADSSSLLNKLRSLRHEILGIARSVGKYWEIGGWDVHDISNDAIASLTWKVEKYGQYSRPYKTEVDCNQDGWQDLLREKIADAIVKERKGAQIGLCLDCTESLEPENVFDSTEEIIQKEPTQNEPLALEGLIDDEWYGVAHADACLGNKNGQPGSGIRYAIQKSSYAKDKKDFINQNSRKGSGESSPIEVTGRLIKDYANWPGRRKQRRMPRAITDKELIAAGCETLRRGANLTRENPLFISLVREMTGENHNENTVRSTIRYGKSRRFKSWPEFTAYCGGVVAAEREGFNSETTQCKPTKIAVKDDLQIVKTSLIDNEIDAYYEGEDIDPKLAPTLAEFQKLIKDGVMPPPDVVIHGIPLYKGTTLSQAKAGNPADYTQHYAASCANIAHQGIPPELRALVQYEGVELYRIEGKGVTDHRLAIGLKVTGRTDARGKGTLRYKIAQKGLRMAHSEKHLVTAWLAYNYWGEARDNKELASKVKGAKDRGLERQVKSEGSMLAEHTLSGTPDAGLLIKAVNQISQMQKSIDVLASTVNSGMTGIMSGMTEMEQRILNQIGQSGLNKVNLLKDLDVFDMPSAEEWLRRFEKLIDMVSEISNGNDEIRLSVDRLLKGKRDEVTKKLELSHALFLWNHPVYKGCCPVTGDQIVGLINGIPDVTRDENGRKKGEVDHNFAVNRADKCTTWLVSTPVNRRANNDSGYRIELQPKFQVYQCDLSKEEIPIFKALLPEC